MGLQHSLGSERSVAWLIFVGIAIVVVCLAFGHLIGLALAAWGLRPDATAVFLYSYGTTAGVLTFATGLGLGLLRAYGVWPKAEDAAIEDAYVVSVSALNDRQEPIWNEGVFDVRSVHRYVQFRSGSRVLELEAGSNQIAGLAEGQTGRLVFSGTRLVSFVPNVEPERAPWIS